LESVIWKICGVIRYGTSNLLLACVYGKSKSEGNGDEVRRGLHMT
jgi:hypothetical protein